MAWKNVKSTDEFKPLAVAALRRAAGATTERVTCVERDGNKVRGRVFVSGTGREGTESDGLTYAEVLA